MIYKVYVKKICIIWSFYINCLIAGNLWIIKNLKTSVIVENKLIDIQTVLKYRDGRLFKIL